MVLIIDGLGDRPVPGLDGRTPLEAASTPTLDSLARQGRCGQLDPIGAGIIPDTHLGVGMLMGLHPDDLCCGERGPVEAAGLGIRVGRGDVALRANFATLTGDGPEPRVVDRRAGRVGQSAAALAALFDRVDLGDGITASLQSTEQHRCLLLLQGNGLGAAISDTDPGDGGMPGRLKRSEALNEESRLAAEKLNHFLQLAHEQLREHPINREREGRGLLSANGLITRGAGGWAECRNYVADRGVSAAVVAGCNTVRGLAARFGFTVIRDATFTADAETSLENKITAARRLMGSHSLVYVHIKAPDLFAHDRDAEGKAEFLERIDRAMAPHAWADHLVVVSADHTTDSNSGRHTADPVPLLLSGPGIRADGLQLTFGERNCASGGLGRQTSAEFLQGLLEGIITPSDRVETAL